MVNVYELYLHTSEYGETFLAVSSTKIDNEGIKILIFGRSITNFFTDVRYLCWMSSKQKVQS